jgi:uncharacterized protein
MAGIWNLVSLVNNAKQTVGSFQKIQGQMTNCKETLNKVQSDLVQRDYDRAAAGNPQAQFEMGERFYQGSGVGRDFGPAAGWFALAANQGHPDAQRNLAFMLFLGRGVEMDLAEAYKWICLAAQHGRPDLQEARRKMAAKIPPAAVQEGERRAGLPQRTP